MIYINYVTGNLNCGPTADPVFDWTGYKMDETDPDSNYLRLQFSRYPGPRSGPGSRGKRTGFRQVYIGYADDVASVTLYLGTTLLSML